MEKFNKLSNSPIKFNGIESNLLSYNDWNKTICDEKKIDIDDISIYKYKNKNYLYDAHHTTWKKSDNCVRDNINKIVDNFNDINNLGIYVMTGRGTGVLRKELANWSKTYFRDEKKFYSLTSKVYDENGIDRDDIVIIKIKMI